MPLPSDHALIRALVAAGVAAIDADVKHRGANVRFEAAVWAVAEEEAKALESVADWKNYVIGLFKRDCFMRSGINKDYVEALLRPSRSGTSGVPPEEVEMRKHATKWLSNVAVIFKKKRLDDVEPPQRVAAPAPRMVPKVAVASRVTPSMAAAALPAPGAAAAAAPKFQAANENESKEEQSEESEEESEESEESSGNTTEEDERRPLPKASVGGAGAAAAAAPARAARAVPAAAVGGGGSAPAAAVNDQDSVEITLTVTITKKQFLAAYVAADGGHLPHLAWRKFKEDDLDVEGLDLTKPLVEDWMGTMCYSDYPLCECYRCGLMSYDEQGEGGWNPYQLSPCATCFDVGECEAPAVAALVPKVLYCDSCLESHTCATAKNPLLPLDPKNLPRLLALRENLDAAEEAAAQEAAQRKASCMEPASPPATKAPVPQDEEKDFHFIDLPDFMLASPPSAAAGGAAAPPAASGGAPKTKEAARPAPLPNQQALLRK